MPTTRPRHQITETPTIAHALKIARRRWPSEPHSTLLARLIQAGSAAIEEEQQAEVSTRLEAIDAVGGKYDRVFSDDYLDSLRQEWPE